MQDSENWRYLYKDMYCIFHRTVHTSFNQDTKSSGRPWYTTVQVEKNTIFSMRNSYLTGPQLADD